MPKKNVDYDTIRIDARLQIYSTQGWKIICELGTSSVRRKILFGIFFFILQILFSIVVSLYS